MCYLLVLRIQLVLYRRQPFVQLRDIEISHLRDVLISDLESERFLFQSLSMAFGTLCRSQELCCPFLACCRVIILHDVGEVFDDAIEGHEIIACCMNDTLVDAHALHGAIHDLVDSLLWNVFIRCLEIAVVFLQ